MFHHVSKCGVFSENGSPETNRRHNEHSNKLEKKTRRRFCEFCVVHIPLLPNSLIYICRPIFRVYKGVNGIGHFCNIALELHQIRILLYPFFIQIIILLPSLILSLSRSFWKIHFFKSKHWHWHISLTRHKVINKDFHLHIQWGSSDRIIIILVCHDPCILNVKSQAQC